MTKQNAVTVDTSVPTDMDMSDEDEVYNSKFLERWQKFTSYLKMPLQKLLLGASTYAALNPAKTIIFTIFLSFGMIAAGFKTNFRLETDNGVLWSPSGSITANQAVWVASPEISGFPQDARKIVAIIHAHGEDVLHLEGMNYVFDIMDEITSMEGYRELCVDNIFHVIDHNDTL